MGEDARTYAISGHSITIKHNPLFDTVIGSGVTAGFNGSKFTIVNPDPVAWDADWALRMAEAYNIEVPYDMDEDDPKLIEWIHNEVDKQERK